MYRYRTAMITTVLLILALPVLLADIDTEKCSIDISIWEEATPVGQEGDNPGASSRGNGWLVRTVDWTGIVGQTPSLAIGPGNAPHLCYYDYTRQDLRYARWNGSGWDLMTVDAEGHVGRYPSLALDSSGIPHVSYFDISRKKLKYATQVGEDWHIEVVNDTTDEGSYSSLALDGDDLPHISYFDLEHESLRYATFDGSLWYTETVDGEGGDGGYTSMALDSAGLPRIAYCISGSTGLRYAVHNGTDWSVETLDVEGDSESSLSLVVDDDDVPHIAYLRSDGSLVYAVLYASWANDTVDEAGIPGHASMDMDPSGGLHISYFAGTEEDLRYAVRAGGAWHTELVESQGRIGEHCSLALDSGGIPHIGYYDDDNKDLRLALLDNSTPIFHRDQTEDFPTTGDPFVFIVNVSDDNGVADVKLRYTYDFEDYYRVSMIRGHDGLWRKTMEIPSDARVLNYSYIVYDEANNMLSTNAFELDVLDDDRPVARTGDDIEVPQHETVLLEGNGSTDNVGVTGYAWNFSYRGEEQVLDGMRAEFTFDTAGLFNVTLTVSDDAGNSHIDSILVTVLDITRPVMDIRENIMVNMSETAILSAALCRDNVGIDNYTWTFSYDGSVVRLYGESMAFTFDIVGRYNVTLNATDAAGNGNETMINLTVVDNVPPVADAGIDLFKDQGHTVIFSGANCVDNVGIDNYTWVFDYGDESIKLYGPNPRFTFERPGNYTVILEVMDAGGNRDGDEMLVYIKGRAPVDDDDDTGDVEPDDDGVPGEEVEKGGISMGTTVMVAVISIVVLFSLGLGVFLMARKIKRAARNRDRRVEYDKEYTQLYGKGCGEGVYGDGGYDFSIGGGGYVEGMGVEYGDGIGVGVEYGSQPGGGNGSSTDSEGGSSSDVEGGSRTDAEGGVSGDALNVAGIGLPPPPP